MKWAPLYAVAAIFLLSVIGFSLIIEPEQRVFNYADTQIRSSKDWDTYRYNINHNGVAPEDTTVDSGLILEWRTRRLNTAEYTASKSSPAVNGDHIYLGLDTGALVSISRETGLVEWSFYTRRSRNGIHGSPTVDPDRGFVYIGAYDGWIYAVDQKTGRKIWENKLGHYIGSSPTLYDGVLYIGVEMNEPNGYLVGVDADTGREVFRSEPLGNHPHSTPSIDPESGCIFIGENSGHLYCYWITNQTMRWSYSTGADIKSTPTINDGVVYITSWDTKLHAIDIQTGEPVWTYKTSASSMSSATIDPETGIIYFGNHRSSFYALNSTTGTLIWRFNANGIIQSSPTLVKSTKTIIFGTRDNTVYLLNAATGVEKQEITLQSGFTGVPVTVGDHLYLFDHLGYLYSFVNP